MLARPVATALACRQCQSAVLRAVVARPASIGIRRLPLLQARQLPIRTQRFFSQEKSTETAENKQPETASAEDDIEAAESAKSDDDVPWFLEVEPPRHPPSQHAVELPKIPEDAPAILEPMMKYIFEDMGLDDISLLDLRDLDPPAALGPNLLMLFGTTRSERHLHVASGRFVRWLRRNHKISARADGLIGPGELRIKLRRLRKKAKLMGTNTAIIPGGDNGISTGWVCVNFSTDDNNSGEVESFDESGRFSGFGTSLTGTTIVVQCMTEARRGELDLETLWRGVLKRNLLENKKAKGERASDKEELDALVDSKIQLPTTPSQLQWQALQQASRQQRSYSTSARRLGPAVGSPKPPRPQPPVTEAKSDDISQDSEEIPVPSLEEVRKLVTDIQLVGIPMAQNTFYNIIRHILMAPSDAEDTGAERLALVDQLIATTEERGMQVWGNELFLALIEGTNGSPAYGPELEGAQERLDHLIAQKGTQFDLDQIMRLMLAYASREDWTRFWDAFRMPSRFKVAKEPRHYELAYSIMTKTGSQVMCINALRWVYPDMISQNPPVYPVGSIYKALKACILVADPRADTLYKYGLPRTRDVPQERRFENREMLKLLGAVEELKAQVLAHDAAKMTAEMTAKTTGKMTAKR